MTALNIPQAPPASTRTRRRPDIERIKQLGAQDVAERLGLVEQDTKTHWRFKGYEGSAWIRFYENGQTWHGFKHNGGGDAISLVQASISGAPNFEVDPSLFLDACHKIAAAFSLWAEAPHQFAKKLAKTKRTYKTASEYLGAVVKTIDDGQGGRPWGVASRVFEALDLDPETITLNPDAAGTGCLCWQPITPWQDVRISTVVKTYDDVERTVFGGWTKERAENNLHKPDAMRIIMHDFDGINARDIKPKIEHIEFIARELKRRGLEPAVVVWSSYGKEDEAKAHMYWKTSKAGNFDQWQRRWAFLRSQIMDIAKEGFTPEVAATLRPDTCTNQVQRIVRVPGYTPFGKKHAATIHSCSGAEVDIDAIIETQPVRWEIRGEDKVTRWTMGATCTMEVEEEGKGCRTQTIADNIWPVARWVDGKNTGLVVRIHRQSGEVVYTDLRAGQLVERSGRAKIAFDLANIGGMVRFNKDRVLSDMVAMSYQWRPLLLDRTVELETRPGWHGNVYVQKEGIFEDKRRSFFATGDRIRRRGHAQGTTEEWVENVAKLATTPALALALLVSFSGALVRRNGQHPFMVHLFCRSSQGKSSASTLAASIWGPGEVSGTQGLYYSWNVTATYPEVIAEAATDACAIMDDTSKWRGSDEELANVIHLFGGTMGRGRCFQTGEGQPLRRWYCTTLSNGETGILDQIGGSAIGGHFVRVLDVQIGEGECAKDASHADAMRAAASEFYGSVSHDWITLLQGISDQEMSTIQEHHVQKARLKCGDRNLSSEQQRVMRIIGLLWHAGTLLIHARLMPWTLEFLESVIQWTIDRTIVERHQAQDTPEYRYAERLVNYIDEDARRAPWVDGNGELSAQPSGYVGYRQGDRLYVLAKRLKAVRLTKEITGNAWLKWAEDQGGLVVKRGRMRVAEENRNFWVLDMEKLESLANACSKTDWNMFQSTGTDLSSPEPWD